MNKFLLTGFIIFIATSPTKAQDTTLRVVNATGGTFTQGEIIYEWSIGELALIDEMQSTDGKNVVTNGFLQNIAKNIKKDTVAKLGPWHEISILPNPTRGKLQVNLHFLQTGTARLILYNETGYIMFKKELPTSGYLISQIIHMDNFAAGNYFLLVELTANNIKKQQIYKVIKVHQ